jgi:hypothetical protein
VAALGGVPAQGVGERKQPEQGLQQLPAKHALALLVAADEGGIAGAQLARLAAGQVTECSWEGIGSSSRLMRPLHP